MRQRIESILSQSYPDYELILLDDCSTDDSWEVMRRYEKNPHVTHVVRNATNSGSPFLQWEKGIRLSQGEYIWIAESDDWADLDFLRVCVEQLDAHPGAALCHTGSIFVDEAGSQIDKSYDRWREDGSVHIFRSVPYFLRNMTFWDDCYNASKVVFRRSAYDRLSAEYKTFRYAGDWLFMASLVAQGDVIRVHRKLNYYRWHGNNVTTQGEREGKALRENIRKYSILFTFPAMSRYNRWLVCGMMYKLICRQAQDPAQRATLMQEASGLLGMRPWHYVLERVNKTLSNIFPWLPGGSRYSL
ncbi:MAG: glycosyltransferase [Bacteroidaceae bacterium]|nr:glycosyltransferase [Bacteroidaceae bacterium]